MKSIKETYVIVTIRKWHLKNFEKKCKSWPGEWILVNNAEELTYDYLSKLNPRFIFFPHWSKKVSDDIIKNFECVCFHETDLPYGRGGSPIQNLILRGFESTKISAIKMTDKLDAGPIYLKKDLSLVGIAEEIYIRSSNIIFDMIKEIVKAEPIPKNQIGEPVFFKRRTPDESLISEKIETIEELFDFIRMLDAEDYPKANIIYNNFKMEISNPSLKTDKLVGNIMITLKE